MVTRLFSRSSSQSSNKSSTPPPPPPASHKPKSPFLPTCGKPPRRRPNHLPVTQASSSSQQGPQSPSGSKPGPHASHPLAFHHSSSLTPPPSTFRNSSLGAPLSAASRCNHPLNLPRQTSMPVKHLGSGEHGASSGRQDGAPSYPGCFLELTRTRSDESLLWTAEEEASALVAELRASLSSGNASHGDLGKSPSTSSDLNVQASSRDAVVRRSGFFGNSSAHQNPYLYRRSGSHTSQQGSAVQSPGSDVSPSSPASSEVVPIVTQRSKPICPVVPQQQHYQPFQRSFSVHRRCSQAREAALKLSNSGGRGDTLMSPPRSHSYSDLQSAVELQPLHRNGSSSSSHLGGSGQELSATKDESGRLESSSATSRLKSFGGSWKSLLRVGAMSGRCKPAGVVKKVPPPTIPGSTTTMPPPPLPPPPSQAPPDGDTSSYRHSGSSFHSSLSSGVFSSSTTAGGGGVDQRCSFSSCSEDAVSTHSNPPPSPCSPSSGTGSIDSAGALASSTTSGRPSTASSGAPLRLQQVYGGSSSPHHIHHKNANFHHPPPSQFTFPSTSTSSTTSSSSTGTPQFAHLLCKGPPQHPGSPHHSSSVTTTTGGGGGTPEDQGIDVQSPIRSSSPGSSTGSGSSSSTTSCCRNSTTSLDSGRASSTTQHNHTHHQNRLSGHSYDSSGANATGSLRHSYHSSSSSIGSIESPLLNVNDLLNNGVRDSEVLRAWLTELHMEEYYEKFVNAGYDMPTISRMTPEDLNAIGVTRPVHRKKLKTEITRLNIYDALPDYIPNTLDEWLSCLRLSEYSGALHSQGYSSPLQMVEVMWEDLEEMGISKLGHQKKVMLAIKRIKDIKSGKKFTSHMPPPPPPAEIILISRDSHHAVHHTAPAGEVNANTTAAAGTPSYIPGDLSTFSQSSNTASHPSTRSIDHHHHQGTYSNSSNSTTNSSTTSYNPNGAQFSPSVFRSFQGVTHSPLHRQSSNGTKPFLPVTSSSNGSQPPSLQYRPDFVPVQVQQGQLRKTREGVFEEPIYSTFHPDAAASRYSHQTPAYSSLPPRPSLPSIGNNTTCYPQRSLDDGDITPTNEMVSAYEATGGGSTLPRHRTNKLRPVAKVTAKTRVEVHQEMAAYEAKEQQQQFKHIQQHISSVPEPVKPAQTENLKLPHRNEAFPNPHLPHSTSNTPQGTPKKLPPPPPRRSNSVSESSKLESTGGSNRGRFENQYGFLRRGSATNSSTSSGGFSYGYMGVKNNIEPDISSDLPPPPPAPHDVGNHQFIHHHPSHRRPQHQLMTAQHEVEEEDFPPPPPPSSSAASNISSSTSIKSPADQPPPPPPPSQAPISEQHHPAVVMRPRRNDSTVSTSSHKSTSSTDSSDSLPFANDNAGTIKQRYNNGTASIPPHLYQHSPLSSPHSSPASLRRSTPHRSSLRPAALQKQHPGDEGAGGGGDVLSDIGNMLANLTDELDAMLEQEMTAASG